MTLIKKWIITLAFLLTVIGIDYVNAVTYTANDNATMSTQYHDLFNNYFDSKKSYQYFQYSCVFGNTTRQCYYGIDSDFNYLMIDYYQSSTNVWTIRYSKGIDKNFAVNGINVFKKSVDNTYILTISLTFFSVLVILGILTKRRLKNENFI